MRFIEVENEVLRDRLKDNKDAAKEVIAMLNIGYQSKAKVNEMKERLKKIING